MSIIKYTIIVDRQILGDIAGVNKEAVAKVIKEMTLKMAYFKNQQVIRFTNDFNVFLDELAREYHIFNRRWKIYDWTPVTNAPALKNTIEINFRK